MNEIIEKFEKANLSVTLLNSASEFGGRVDNDLIFMMDVATDKHGNERFRIYTGASDNKIDVVYADAKVRQIILRVKEPARKFTEKRWNSRKHDYEEITRRTSSALRNYLCGMDETHLFISELPRNVRVTNLRDAYHALKPKEVLDAKSIKIKRQGEWFFVPLSVADEEELKELMKIEPIKKNDILPRISSRSKPHTAQYRIGNFVMGRIRHSDHHTLKLKDWHRFIRNTELSASANSRFID